MRPLPSCARSRRRLALHGACGPGAQVALDAAVTQGMPPAGGVTGFLDFHDVSSFKSSFNFSTV